MAMTEVMKEAIWLQGFLDNLGIDQNLLKINCDSMSAIYLAKNIYVRFHFVREILDEGDIELLNVHTKKNPDQGGFGSEICTLQGVTPYPFRVA